MTTKQMSSTVGAAFWITCFIFNITGPSNSYLANELDVKGIGNPLTGFQVAIVYISETTGALIIMLCQGRRLNKKLLALSFEYCYILVIDLVGNLLYWGGLGFIGSGLTTLLYSSIIVYAGIFSRVFFHKPISSVRWACIFGLWASVGLSAAGQVNSVGGAGQVIGIFAVLLSALFFGLNFVLVDNILGGKISPLETSFLF